MGDLVYLIHYAKGFVLALLAFAFACACAATVVLAGVVF